MLGCAIQCSDRDRFLEPIYQFNQFEHMEFLNVLEKNKFNDEGLGDNKVIQIKDLMTKVEVLNIENDNLEKAMNDQMVELQLLKECIAYLTEENTKLKQEIYPSI